MSDTPSRIRHYGALLARGLLVVLPAATAYGVLVSADRQLALALMWVIAFGMLVLIELQWPWGGA